LALRVDEKQAELSSNIISFPKSKEWTWSYRVLVSQVIPPYTPRYIVYEEEGAGWIYFVLLFSTSKDLRFVVDIMADEIIEIDLSIAELWELGGAELRGFRIVRFDDTASKYVVEYAPGLLGFPGTPFRDRNRFYLVNPTSSPIIVSLWAWLIKLK